MANPLLPKYSKSIRIPIQNSQKITILPKKFDDFIFKNLGAKYDKLFGKSDFTHSARNEGLDHTESDLKKYLGTYWPRSFIESYNIVNNLLKSIIINTNFSSKTELDILDIGSGTGGDLIGLMDCLDNEFDNKFQYNIFSIDGNEKAVEIQKSLIEEFYPVSYPHYAITNKDFRDKNQFLKTLSILLDQNQHEYDIILNFKFVNEFYRGGGYNFNEGMYCDLLDNLRLFLKEDGIFILTDLTDKDGQNKPDIFFPVIMNREIQQFLNYRNQNFKLFPIIPLNCATNISSCLYWNNCYKNKSFLIKHSNCNTDKSKLNYFVFTHDENAKRILNNFKNQNLKNCDQNDIFDFEFNYNYKSFAEGDFPF